ncbi:MAG: AraC family transcriptional regulator [bacterium]|jgi:AraC family transcriptional regulator
MNVTSESRYREEYIARINRVIDYIEENIEDELRLEDLAQVANFSSFHFHRIFRSLVKETLNQFIQRLRVERAAIQLTNSSKKSVTEIAFDCGFSSSSSFARVFKDYYKMSATEWKKKGNLQNSKIRKVNSKEWKEQYQTPVYSSVVSYQTRSITKEQQWSIQMEAGNTVNVEVKEMPELNVAYLRHIGPYKGDSDLFGSLFNKLTMWAGARGVFENPNTQLLSIPHDDPNITEEEKLRLSVCITIPSDFEVDGEIGKMVVPRGKYAVARFDISCHEFEQSWSTVCGEWLPNSGYQFRDGLCYEIYQNNPEEHPEKRHIIDICIPVKPL